MKQVWDFVKNDKTKFPLSASMIGMTKISIEILRKGKLNSLIIAQKSVSRPLNALYFALLRKMYIYFKFQKKTIRDYGFLRIDLEKEALINPIKLIE